MINAKLLLRHPVKYKKDIMIYPPSVDDVVGNESFNQYRTVFTLSHEELEDEFHNKTDEEGNPVKIPTPFEFLMVNAYGDKEYYKVARDAFQFFTHQPALFLFEEKKILVGDIENKIKDLTSLEELTFITEEEFLSFQNKIREVLNEPIVEPPDPTEDPRIKRIKAKARYRDKVKAKQGGGLTLGTSLAAICCMGIGLNPLNIGEMSYSAVKYLMDMYQAKEQFDIDMRSLMAGADSKKVQPKYWIKNLE